MSIRLEYIVCNKNGDELNRFSVKAEAEAYDSVICAAEDISLILKPLQSKLSLSDEQIYAISEHFAFQADEVKLAMKQIKKLKHSGQISGDKLSEPQTTEKQQTPIKKSSKKKSL
jgi:dsDNA-binding SOS-regulon protein